VKAFLSRAGVPFVEHNISSDPAARHAFLESGYDVLPVLEIGGSVLIEETGEARIMEALVREGYFGSET
jgi:hypothetical protein